MMWTALLMGLGGSLHCAGMCSPLVLSVTVFNRNVLLNRIIYNAGRILVYGSLGALMASIGSLIDFSPIQNTLSISLGLLLILIGFGTISHLRIPYLTPGVNKLIGWIKKMFGKMIQRKNYGALLIMGMLNGILPCGLTYLTLSYTLTLNSAWQGFLFMMTFGLGTLPIMMGLPFVMQFFAKSFRVNFTKITTVMMISLGILLIVRTVITHNHQEMNSTISISEPVICR